MHKIEEIYWREQVIDDIEINLFEPECIITDNIKDDTSLFAFESNSKEGSTQGMYLDTERDLGLTSVNNLKDCVTIKPISNKPTAYEDDSTNAAAIFCDRTSMADAIMSATNAYLESIQMHSIFTPDKRLKPKEIFTQCHFCGKYVIIRMCPETGTYSKCKHCFNTPVSFIHKNVYENASTQLPVETEISVKPDFKLYKNVLSSENANHSKSDGAFKCEHCGKLFTRNWYLKQHIKLHLNEKPFACDHCDKRFLNSSNLKQHMRTHSVEYRCCICNKTCISQNALKEHILKHDNDTKTISVTNVENAIQTAAEDLRVQKLECKFCKQTFIDESRLKEHLQSHTKELPYHCDKCDKSFRYNNTLAKHKKLHDEDNGSSFKLKRIKGRAKLNLSDGRMNRSSCNGL